MRVQRRVLRLQLLCGFRVRGILGRGETVLHPVASWLRHHNAYLVQVFQTMRTLRLVCLKNFSEVTDSDFAPVQWISKSKPPAIG